MTISTLNVNPQDLINTADEFNGHGQNIGNITSDMMSLITGLSSIWEGDAAQGYISKFTQLDDDIERMLSMVNEHVCDLEEMAMNYEDSEVSNIDSLDVLSVDVIV